MDATSARISVSRWRKRATIAVNYNSSKAEAEAVAAGIVKAGGRATAYQADVSNLAQVTSMVAQVKSDFSGLDILVNNVLLQ